MRVRSLRRILAAAVNGQRVSDDEKIKVAMLVSRLSPKRPIGHRGEFFEESFPTRIGFEGSRYAIPNPE